MTNEVPTANWAALFKEIPLVLEHLRAHDAHCSKGAAFLLDGGLFALKTHDAAKEWAELVPVIGMLAIEANDHRRDELPQKTLDFIDRVEGAFSQWLETPSSVL